MTGVDVVDLRSDTVTTPCAGMRAAITAAEVGDAMYGEDPTVAALEARLSAMFGFDGAIFVPSGVMANQIAVRLLVPPGAELVCDAEAHLVANEGGAHAGHGGVQTRTLSTSRGLLDPDELAGFIRRAAPYTVRTAAVAVEQTHARAGGVVYPLPWLQRLHALADEAGIALHMDGARIWNAHVATGTPLIRYGAIADTLSVCLSKGLGAPVGSVLMTDAHRLQEARVLRQRLGGGMRQAGLLAAAGIYALDHNVDRLADDHRNAVLLANGLRAHGVTVRPVETNIVLVETSAPESVAGQAARLGVKVSAMGPTLIRLVTHLGISTAACERAVRVLAAVERTAA